MYRFREIWNHDCAWKSYRGMECDLNGNQSIRYVNGHVDILYSYDVSFAVQYTSSCNSNLFVCLIDSRKRKREGESKSEKCVVKEGGMSWWTCLMLGVPHENSRPKAVPVKRQESATHKTLALPPSWSSKSLKAGRMLRTLRHRANDATCLLMLSLPAEEIFRILPWRYSFWKSLQMLQSKVCNYVYWQDKDNLKTIRICLIVTNPTSCSHPNNVLRSNNSDTERKVCRCNNWRNIQNSALTLQLSAILADSSRKCVIMSTVEAIECETCYAKKPTEPIASDCCGTGCSPCVFDLYEAELRAWRESCDRCHAGAGPQTGEHREPSQKEQVVSQKW